MKKAQIEVSFNWIFVILAGGAILFFFLNVINTQTETGRETISAAITNRMDAIFSALESSQNSVQVQERLNFDMQFYCQEDGHSYSVNEGNARNYMPTRVLFTPKIIGNSNLITWTLKHEEPYPITNLLLISDERTAYVFVESVELYNLLPEEFTKFNLSLDDLSNFQEQGHRHYIFISNTTTNMELSSFNADYSMLKYSKIDFGTIEFEDDNDALEDFYGTQMLLGAIITGDKDLFRCSKEKIQKKANIMHDLIINKTDYIRQNYEDGSNCGALYQPALINQKVENLKNPSNYNEEFHEYVLEIKDHNTRLLRTSCATIY